MVDTEVKLITVDFFFNCVLSFIVRIPVVCMEMVPDSIAVQFCLCGFVCDRGLVCN